jgi:hypothetical protein
MLEREITIDTEEIEDFIYNRLIQKHFVPSQVEVEEISNIFFDYLVKKRIIKEVNE